MSSSYDDSYESYNDPDDEETTFVYCCDVYDNEDSGYMNFYEALTL